VAAAAGEPTITAALDSGPPGLTVGVSGTSFQAGTTYGLCLLPRDQDKCGYAGSDLGSFTADASGNIPAGTQFRVPGVLAGSYLLIATAPGTAAFVATTPFGVTAPTLSVDPNAGPGGLTVTVAGSGYGPAAAYSLCIVPSGTPQCGGIGIPLGDVTADGSGSLPGGTTVTIPGQLAATYDIGVMLKGGALPNLLVTTPFVEVAPTVLLNPVGGPGGTIATITGAGLAPGGHYTVCIVPSGTNQCGGAGTDLVGFVADAAGAIPAGTTMTIPAGDPGDLPVGVVLDDSTAFLLGSVTFSRTTGTPPPPASTSGAGPSGGAASGTPAVAASSVPSSAPGASDVSSGGMLLWILVVLLIVAVLIGGLVLSRRRRSAQSE
jgi:hypothetical protein